MEAPSTSTRPTAAQPRPAPLSRAPEEAARTGRAGRSERAERWAWRRRVRADPRKHRIYRGAIAVVGVAMVLLGLVTGPLPGPGGIPLVLGGLAVLASEFHWARRLLDWAKVRLHAFSAWAGAQPVWVRWTGTVAVLAALGGLAYLGLVLVGVPALVPDAVTAYLTLLPGVEA